MKWWAVVIIRRFKNSFVALFCRNWTVCTSTQYSVPSTSIMSWKSPQVTCRWSSQPLNPKWKEFINHNVFNKASALVIPSRFFMYRILTFSSVIASAAPSLPFSGVCFEFPRLFEFVQIQGPPLCSLDIYKLSSDSWSWKEILWGSNSSPSFLLIVIKNLLKKSFGYSGGIFSSFSPHSFPSKTPLNGNVSPRFW